MENIILTIHLLITLCLIIVVLLQRSEGGGLGIGGGSGGAVSSRGAATALTKVTWILAAGFMATSLTLVVLSVQGTASDSVLDRLGIEETDGSGIALPPTLDGDLTAPLPSDGPATPPKADE